MIDDVEGWRAPLKLRKKPSISLQIEGKLSYSHGRIGLLLISQVEWTNRDSSQINTL
jgi:hypothetical protein